MASATEASMADYCYKDRMFALLVERLAWRDGFTLCRSGGLDGRDDVLIRNVGQHDVYVRMKDSAVTTADVEKFEQDIEKATRGIMCTLDGKIAKRSAVDFRRLWGSGFVFYLANVNHDVDLVVAFLKVIYGMDERTAGGDATGELRKADVLKAKSVCKAYMKNDDEGKAARLEGLRELWDSTPLLPPGGRRTARAQGGAVLSTTATASKATASTSKVTVLGMRHSVAVSVGALVLACDRYRSDYTACRGIIPFYDGGGGVLLDCAPATQHDT